MTLQQIEDVTIAQGDTISVGFEFVDKNKQPLDLSGYDVYYIISYYGFEEENVLSKRMDLEEGTTNTFSCTLTSNDTENLVGTYTVKIVMKDSQGYLHKKARGVMSVLKDTNEI